MEVVTPGVRGRRVRMWYADGRTAHVEVEGKRAMVTLYSSSGAILLLDWPAEMDAAGDLRMH